jgi:hypothetical protein
MGAADSKPCVSVLVEHGTPEHAKLTHPLTTTSTSSTSNYNKTHRDDDGTPEHAKLKHPTTSLPQPAASTNTPPPPPPPSAYYSEKVVNDPSKDASPELIVSYSDCDPKAMAFEYEADKFGKFAANHKFAATTTTTALAETPSDASTHDAAALAAGNGDGDGDGGGASQAE